MAGSDVHVNPDDVKVIPYTPITSLASELGILFAFLGLCIVTMALYWFIWQAVQRRNAAIETARVEALTARSRVLEEEKWARERANRRAADAWGLGGAGQRGRNPFAEEVGLAPGDTERDLMF